MLKFHHEMFPTSFKDLFQKTAEVHCHNTRYATNQNYFIQQISTTLAKKTISHRGAALWENADQQFKDKPTPLVINPDHFCCCNMDECLKNYTTGYI